MNTYFLSLGSNIEPEKNIPACLEIFKKEFTVKKISSVYETEPVGPAAGGKFWNLAVQIETPKNKTEAASAFRNIESRLGRVRGENKFAPRTMDIDVVPQPGYQTLGFIIIPLSEISPDMKDEETGRTWLELAKVCSKTGMIKKNIQTP